MITEAQVVVFMLVLARVSAFIAFFPLFSRRQLPNSVKAGLALALTAFWYGTVESSLEFAGDSAYYGTAIGSVLLLAREITIGIVLSIILGVFFLPAKVAGAYIGQEIGLSLASISDPGSADSSTLVTRILEAFAILIFFSINLHHFLILVIHTSFEKMAGRIDVLNLPFENLVAILNDVSDYGLLIIGPVAVMLMLVTIGLAYLNKAAPTLNLFSVGLSIRCGFGIFCLILFLPVVFGAVQAYLYRTQEDIELLLMNFK